MPNKNFDCQNVSSFICWNLQLNIFLVLICPWSYLLETAMEAIKKKMQAMKVEKDNLMDRCDACEQVEFRKYLYHFHEKLFFYSLVATPSWGERRLKKRSTSFKTNQKLWRQVIRINLLFWSQSQGWVRLRNDNYELTRSL